MRLEDKTDNLSGKRAAQEAKVSGSFSRFLRKPLALSCSIVLLAIVVSCAFAPLIAPYSPFTSSFSNVLSGPSAHYLLGTDELGRDILSRLLFGGRPTLLAAGEATVIAVGLGTILGIIAGYRRGSADRAISALGDLLLAMPVLVVLIVVVSVFPSSPYPAMIPLGVLLSAAPMRVLRSVTLSVREELYIDAARVNGLSHREIMVRHVFPRIRGPVIVQATLAAAVAVVFASGLAFLGFGIQVPAPSWGSMVAEAASQYQRQPWFLVPTGGIIALTVLCLGLLGDGVRDVFAEGWTGQMSGGARRSSRRPIVVEAPGSTTETADSSNAVLSVSNLCVSASESSGRSTQIVDNVSFRLERGRTLAIVGESGCGKTMAARGILGIVPENCEISGHVLLDGQELVGASGRVLSGLRGKHMGFVSQDAFSSLDPTQTVGSALREIVRHFKGVNRKEANAEVVSLLTRVQLQNPERVMKLYPHQISGGMAQRVTIARALVGNPKLLVADEPTTALDATVQIGILALLRKLQVENDISILIVTHDWGVVAALADDVLVMYAGQAVERGTSGSVFARPLHPYTRALLQSDPRGATAGEPLRAISGSVPTPGTWPVGCRFAPRCDMADSECKKSQVELKEVALGHDSRCLYSSRLVSES